MINNIASERTRKGLSQAELGEMFGKDRAVISRWENNPMAIDGETLVALSDIFCCSVDYLLGRTEDRVLRNPTK